MEHGITLLVDVNLILQNTTLCFILARARFSHMRSNPNYIHLNIHVRKHRN